MLFLADAHARIGQFDDARRCIGEAMAASEASKESCCDAEVHRVAGEIALMGPQPDASRAEAHFARAIAIARKQKAMSWELLPRPAWLVCGRPRAGAAKRTTGWRRSTAGSPKALIRSI